MKKLIATLLALLLGSSNAFANDSPEKLQQRFVDAVRANDIDAVADCYAPGAVSFPIDDMVGVGTDYVRQSWQGLFTAVKVTDIVLFDSHHENFGEGAVSWGLFTMTVVPHEGGEAQIMQGRFMDASKKFDDTWKYIADHASIPAPPPPED